MTDDTHECPGCTTAGVPRTQLACKPCWFRLPKPLRDDLNSAYRRRRAAPADHRKALRSALLWYSDNPPLAST